MYDPLRRLFKTCIMSKPDRDVLLVKQSMEVGICSVGPCSVRQTIYSYTMHDNNSNPYITYWLKISPSIYGPRRFIFMFIRPHKWTLSWDSSVDITLSYRASAACVLILSSIYVYVTQADIFFWGVQTKLFIRVYHFSIHSICLIHLLHSLCLLET
jgi:hypothetical protein